MCTFAWDLWITKNNLDSLFITDFMVCTDQLFSKCAMSDDSGRHQNSCIYSVEVVSVHSECDTIGVAMDHLCSTRGESDSFCHHQTEYSCTAQQRLK